MYFYCIAPSLGSPKSRLREHGSIQYSNINDLKSSGTGFTMDWLTILAGGPSLELSFFKYSKYWIKKEGGDLMLKTINNFVFRPRYDLYRRSGKQLSSTITCRSEVVMVWIINPYRWLIGIG